MGAVVAVILDLLAWPTLTQPARHTNRARMRLQSATALASPTNEARMRVCLCARLYSLLGAQARHRSAPTEDESPRPRTRRHSTIFWSSMMSGGCADSDPWQ